MKYSPGIFGTLFKSAWAIETLEETLVCSRGSDIFRCDYFDILQVRIENGVVWSSLYLSNQSHTLVFEGLPKKSVDAIYADIVRRIANCVNNRLVKKKLASASIEESIQDLLKSDKYLSVTDIRHWLKKIPDAGTELSHPYFRPDLLPQPIRGVVLNLIELTNKDSKLLRDRNENYVKRTTQEYAWLFNKLEKYPLTEEQMRSAVIDEDRNLLIAAAGSGKSSTVVAKVILTLEKNLATTDEILVLAYNKDAQAELDRRINSHIGITPSFVDKISAKTFHGFGMEIIAKTEGRKPSVAQIATAGKIKSLGIFNELVNTLRRNDPQFARQWRQFQTLAKMPVVDIFKISSRKEYDAYLMEVGAIWKNSNQGRRLQLLTMDGNEVKSMEELRISNWLFMNGVEYKYEQPYMLSTATDSHRQYYPDYYYPQIDVYHEHFALDMQGNAPAFMGQKYVEGVNWKRGIHSQNKTNLIETHSADFHNGLIFEKLEKYLVQRGIELKPRGSDDIDAFIKKSFDVETDIELFMTILRHYKANNLKAEVLRHKAKELPDPYRTSLFIDLFDKIYKEYQSHLGTEIDFEDQINKACSYLEQRKYNHKFKYILVDETQDLSQDRKRMILGLLGQSDEIKLFAVGDDWQSIYRYAGADIDIMTNFSEHFGFTSQNYLTQTFRSYQGIVDVASEFIQRNPTQLNKTVKAHRDLNGDLVFISEYDSEYDKYKQIHSRLADINKLAKDNNLRLSVFILARYNRHKPHECESYPEQYSQLDISFKTIHASKGLEADYVLLLDVNNGRYGFPSKLSDDPLLQLVIPRPETFTDAEERRLLYVAITRAKRAVFIYSEKCSLSSFVKELAEMNRVKAPVHMHRAHPCPLCDTGELKQIRGPHGIFMGCSNYPECKYSVTLMCPSCRIGKLVYRKSQRGEFIGCNKFPKCRYIHKDTVNLNNKVITI